MWGGCGRSESRRRLGGGQGVGKVWAVRVKEEVGWGAGCGEAVWRRVQGAGFEVRESGFRVQGTCVGPRVCRRTTPAIATYT